MKIYPNKSKIIVTNNVNVATDIPLSYIDTQQLDYNINTVIEPVFTTKSKQEVLPYDNVQNNIICLFDNYGNLLDPTSTAKHFKRDEGKYLYIPYNSKTFYPSLYQYDIVVKKHMKYSSKMQYNILAAATDVPLANYIVPIFGDAPYKGNAPCNILVNSGSSSYGDLVSGNLKHKDFLFMQLEDEYTNTEGNPCSIEDTLSYGTNVVASMLFNFKTVINENSDANEKDKIVMYYMESEGNTGTEIKRAFKMKTPSIYDDVKCDTRCYFNIPKNKDGIVYHNLFNDSQFTPALIEEHIGKGFVVYVSDDIVMNAIAYSKLLYECMFYVYSRAYLTSELITDWITEDVPDYIVTNNRLTKKDRFISQQKYYQIFGLEKDEASLYRVNIESSYPYVKYTELTDDYLTFVKDTTGYEDNKDPVKSDGQISVLTSKQTMIYFDEFIYRINDSLNELIAVDKIDNEIKIIIKPFRHSDAGIYLTTNTELTIPLNYVNASDENIQITNADYYIVCKENLSASYLEYVDSTEYTKSMGLILATIQVRQGKANTLLYDMRSRGGGLPAEEKDVYDCFDIGHIYGRPYRKGGSFIITLPKRLEPYKSTIEPTVKQYCAAEEYPIITFKED